MPQTAPHNRIKGHRKVRAGDLVPHELNPRTHSDLQKQALSALYQEVGFARSLLAYELPDGRLKLIDGHLRSSMDPDMEVTVEVLDVTDEEARKLLLSIDPLAQLAGYSDDMLSKLRETTSSDSDALHNLWASVQEAGQAVAALQASTKKKGSAHGPGGHNAELPEKYLVLIECQDEKQQLQLLKKFKKEGLACSAKTT